MLLFKDRRLVRELMGCKSRRMLSLHNEGVLVGKMVVRAESMRVEAMELRGRGCLTSMQAAF